MKKNKIKTSEGGKVARIDGSLIYLRGYVYFNEDVIFTTHQLYDLFSEYNFAFRDILETSVQGSSLLSLKLKIL